jgi:hypothetical protein
MAFYQIPLERVQASGQRTLYVGQTYDFDVEILTHAASRRLWMLVHMTSYLTENRTCVSVPCCPGTAPNWNWRGRSLIGSTKLPDWGAYAPWVRYPDLFLRFARLVDDKGVDKDDLQSEANAVLVK